MSIKLNRQVAKLALATAAMYLAVMPAAAQRMPSGDGMRPSGGSAQGGHMRPSQPQKSPETRQRETSSHDRDHGGRSRWQHAEQGRPDWRGDRGGHDGGRFGGYARRDGGYPGYGHVGERGRGYGPVAGYRGYGWNGFGPVAPVWGRGFAPAYRGWARPAYGYAPVVVVPVYFGWAGGGYNAGPAQRPAYRGWGHGDGGYRQPSHNRPGDRRD